MPQGNDIDSLLASVTGEQVAGTTYSVANSYLKYGATKELLRAERTSLNVLYQFNEKSTEFQNKKNQQALMNNYRQVLSKQRAQMAATGNLSDKSNLLLQNEAVDIFTDQVYEQTLTFKRQGALSRYENTLKNLGIDQRKDQAKQQFNAELLKVAVSAATGAA